MQKTFASGARLVIVGALMLRTMLQESNVAANDHVNQHAAAEAETTQLLPVPEKKSRDQARQRIASIFSIDKVKTPEEKIKLAGELIRTARQTQDDRTAQFVLLNLAREQAVEAGAIRLALEAVDELAAIFQFDADAVRANSFDVAAKATLSATAKRELVDAGIEWIRNLNAKEDFDRALAWNDRLIALARPLRDAELNKVLAVQHHRIATQAALLQQAKIALDKLKTAPDDAEANLAAGRYLMLVRQDWGAGLMHLSKGSDAQLAAAAKLELAAPQGVDEQEKLADAWWAAALAQTDASFKELFRAHSGYLYRELAGDLTGLAKVKAEQRIKEAGNLSLGQPTAVTSGEPTTEESGTPLSENLVVNGDFEQPVIEPSRLGFIDTPAGQTWGSWTQRANFSAGNCLGPSYQAARGDQSYHVGAGSSEGYVSQTFATVPRAKYRLTFWSSGFYGRTGKGKGAPQIGIVSAGDLKRTFETPEGTANENMAWTKQEFEFRATGKTTTLTFGSPGMPAGVISIDDVSVIQIDEANSGRPQKKP